DAMLSSLNAFLNRYTMYRVVLHGLLLLALAAVLLSLVGVLSFPAWTLLASFFTLSFVAYGTNEALAKFVGAKTSVESAAITALILFFLIAPPATLAGFGWLALAAV